MKEQYDRSMSPRASLVAVALVMSLLAACSSGGDASPETTATTPTVTTEADPTTTVAPTTTEAPTTTTTTTIDSTTDAARVLAAEVEADFLETIRLTDEAFRDPANDEKVAAALAGYTAANRDFIQERLETFRSMNWVSTPNPSVAANVIIEEPARLIPPSSDVVKMQVCEIDSSVVMEPGAGPNGTDAIVDAELYTYRSVFFLRLVDGRWLAEGSDELGSWTGVQTCPDE